MKGDEAPEDICDAMIAAMQELTVTGLTGTMVWDATGAVTKTPTAVIIKNGVYVGAEALQRSNPPYSTRFPHAGGGASFSGMSVSSRCRQKVISNS